MITLLLVIAVIGVLVYLVEQLPLAAPFKIVIRALAIIIIILYIVQAFGLDIPLPRVRR